MKVGLRRFSRLDGGLRVGADFFSRRSALASHEPPPRGLVDTMADLANRGVDVTRVHPAIVVFFEETGALELLIRSRWRFPFSLAWRLFHPIMRWIDQFVLPPVGASGRGGSRIATRVLGLDHAVEGRADARAVIREYTDTGRVMQVAVYATRESEAGRLLSVTFPLPGGHIGGVLRLDAIGQDSEGHLAVELTSSSRAGDGAGIWFVMGGVGLRMPLGERMSMWAAGMACAPPELDPAVLPGTTIVGRHEQRVFGIRMVTHDYWFRPV